MLANFRRKLAAILLAGTTWLGSHSDCDTSSAYLDFMPGYGIVTDYIGGVDGWGYDDGCCYGGDYYYDDYYYEDYYYDDYYYSDYYW